MIYDVNFFCTTDWFSYIWTYAYIFFLIFFSIMHFFKLEDNCFTMLYWLCCKTVWISHNHIHICHHPSLSLPPFPNPTPPGHHRAPDWASCVITTISYQLFVVHMVVYICQCHFLSSSYLILPSLYPQFHSPHLHLHSFLANNSISTIFLDSI